MSGAVLLQSILTLLEVFLLLHGTLFVARCKPLKVLLFTLVRQNYLAEDMVTIAELLIHDYFSRVLLASLDNKWVETVDGESKHDFLDRCLPNFMPSKGSDASCTYDIFLTNAGTRVGSTVGGSGMRNHGNRGGFGRGGGFVSGNTGVVPPPSTTGVGLGNSSRKAPQFPSNRWGTKLKPKFIPDSTEAGPGRSGFKRLCVLHSVLTHTSGSGCAATAACRELYGHSRVLTNAELTKCMH